MMFRKLAACWVLVTCWTTATPAVAPLLKNADPPAPPPYEQRATYIRAHDAIRNGRWDAYDRYRRELDGYILTPYLDYHALRARLDKVRTREVTSFLRRHHALPIAPLLRVAWLKSLGSNRQWHTYLKYYRDQSNESLRCYYLRALWGTGRRAEAYKGVGPLWTVSKSQPEACDPIFEVWIQDGGLTEARVWERLGLALAAGERSLARYLITLLGDATRPLGQTYYGAHIQPEMAHLATLLKKDSKAAREIVAHAAERLLRRKEPDAAAQLWDTRGHWAFSPEQKQMFRDAMIVARAEQGTYPAPDAPDLNSSVLRRLAEVSIRTMNWGQAYHWIERLPAAIQTESRWQYWLARSLEETHGMTERVQLTFEALASERHYYGFLAAERVDLPPMLNDESVRPPAQRLMQLRKREDLSRALELYAVGEQIAAKREWRELIPRLEPADQASAAYLAMEVGWLRQSIQAANAAGLHNDLTVRFPIAHMVEYRRMSHATGVPLPMLLAITRQESAFDPRARSHANARGLMQLLPTTAEWVARRAKLSRPTTTGLYRPSTNIEIASHYLAMLMSRYDGSRPLAAAAYNAGERRVDRWIASRHGEPMDVWIENIPFAETRNYVQNVIAFAQVYAQKLEGGQATLGPAEARIPAAVPQLGR